MRDLIYGSMLTNRATIEAPARSCQTLACIESVAEATSVVGASLLVDVVSSVVTGLGGGGGAVSNDDALVMHFCSTSTLASVPAWKLRT